MIGLTPRYGQPKVYSFQYVILSKAVDGRKLSSSYNVFLKEQTDIHGKR
jgi:hypothetical protein